MTFIERDGVKLFYEDGGREGDLAPLLLVHGWTCYHGRMAAQAAHFGADRRIVSVDLRGHGQSDVAGPFTIEQFADDLAWLCGQIDLRRPVVIGHSMGGMIAVQLAATRPDVVRAAAALDSPMTSGLDLSAMGDVIAAFKSPDYMTALQGVVAGMFGPYDDPVAAAEITAVMTAAAHEVVGTAFGSISAWNGEAAIRASTVPLMTIAAAPGGWADAGRLVPECPHLMTGVTVGGGHFIQVMVPDQVNAMLERFLAVIAA